MSGKAREGGKGMEHGQVQIRNVEGTDILYASCGAACVEVGPLAGWTLEAAGGGRADLVLRMAVESPSSGGGLSAALTAAGNPQPTAGGGNPPERLPDMATIKEASRRSGLSYDAIRNMVLQGKVMHYKVGAKRLVNMESLARVIRGEAM
jgi:excisionase family DNA binding protein